MATTPMPSRSRWDLATVLLAMNLATLGLLVLLRAFSLSLEVLHGYIEAFDILFLGGRP